jgi:hypothetical protein
MFGLGISADVFYPEDLLNEYQRIGVPGIAATVSITKYRCSNPSFGGTVDAEAVKDGFIGASGGRIIKESGGASPYVDAFTGKGSPEGIGRVLGHVLRYKDAFVKKYKSAGGDLGKCAALLGGYRADQNAEAMQAFCDAYVGLDCNGMVGNYARRVKKNGLGPQHKPKQYYDQRLATRTTLDDVVGFDVIVWADFSHIAIIDSFADLQTVNIVQSTGGGPQMTAHTLVAQPKKLFRIQPPTKVGGDVFVVSNGF